MPILYRPSPKAPTLPQDLNAVALDWDENRRDATNNDGPVSAVCTFVRKADLVQATRGSDFDLLTKTTLEQAMRVAALNEVQEKQDELMNMFEFTSNRDEREARSTLQNITGWPLANVEVKAQFSKQLTPGWATGFSIGGALVVTAGHCVSDLETLSDSFVVFGMTSDLVATKKIPAKSVFSIKRVVLRGVAIDFDILEALRLTPWKVSRSLESMTLNNLHYDCAVIELQATTPAKLALNRLPPTSLAEVFSIGSPSGLPLKYVGNGKVQADTATHQKLDQFQKMMIGELTADNATFVADIDILKGHSGGPLMKKNENSVIGIARAGTVWPIPMTTTADNSSLAVGINRWTSGKTVSVQASTQLAENEIALMRDSTLNTRAFIDGNWLQGSKELRTTDRGDQVYWARYFADSDVVLKLNRFTRVDGLAYFSQSIADTEKQSIDSPSATVSLSIVVGLSNSGNNLNTTVGIEVTATTGTTVAADTLKPSSATGWSPGSFLRWDLTQEDAGTDPRTGTGRLPLAIKEWQNGLCDWASVRVFRKSGSWDVRECFPISIKVLARFERPQDKQQPKRWEQEAFVFGADLVCQRSRDGPFPPVVIGGLLPEQTPWLGPLDTDNKVDNLVAPRPKDDFQMPIMLDAPQAP